MITVQSPTPSIEQSLSYYKRLGFHCESLSDRLLVQDGPLKIEINPDRYSRAGLRFYASNWDSEIEKLKGEFSVINTGQMHVLNDHNGTWLYLCTSSPPQFKDNSSTSILGNYAGISLEVINLQTAVEFWSILGFGPVHGGPEQGWVSLQNKDGFVISLMKPLTCPHLFFNPSLTYFNGGNNLEVIEKIRSAEIPIAEEITHFNKEGKVDNVIVRDPGGLASFIFND